MNFVRLLPRFGLASLLLFCCPALLVTPAAGQKANQATTTKQPGKAGTAKKAKAAAKPTDVAAEQAMDPMDWPNWRGPEQNGISRETGLVSKWSTDGDNLIWANRTLGTRSTPIVMRGKLYTLARHKPDTPEEGERVVCADAATGEILWENSFNVYLSDVPDTRVAWSCCVGDPTTGRVYAMGVNGYFQCLDGDTGKTLWNRSLSEEFGLLTTYGGRTNVPVIHENLVIISGVCTGWGELARPAHRFMAFDKTTGELQWMNGTRLLPDDTTYSTPTLAVLGGQAAMVFGSGDGSVWAFQPRTGVQLWQYQLSQRGLNTSPLVVDDIVYMGQSEENPGASSMGAMAAIRGTLSGDISKTGAIWDIKERMIGKSSMVLLDGRLYAADDSGLLYVVDAASGKVIGKQKLAGTIMRASLLAADGKIYACTTSAWHVLEPTEDGVKIINRMRFKTGEEVHGSPIVSHGRIYLPTLDAMYCIGQQGIEPAIGERPAPPAEDPIGDNTTPATVQLTPAEALVKPGETVNYKVRLFNDRGQLLEESDATYSVDANGEINDQGVFTAGSDAAHVAATVTAKVGELTGTARVRIIPPLPWKFEFNEKDVPITWVGARYRHQVREVDGESMMVKVTTIPKGTRSQSWMGPTDLHDYTIQADIRGATQDDKMPDIGLIAQRYTLDLMGQSQQLQIRMWTSQLNRLSLNVPYEWQPDVWYTLKFCVAIEDGQAVLRGKVWPKADDEPQEWTIELTDPSPNLQGSPGLFGNATGAEIFLDNITVTPN